MRSDLQRLKRDTESGGSSIRRLIADRAEAISSSAQQERKISPSWGGVTLMLILILIMAVLGFVVRPRMPDPKILKSTQITNDGREKVLATPLVTDGTRIYFSEMTDGGIAIAQVSAQGGETALIPVSFPNAVVYDISPNRSELLIGTGSEFENPLWVLPLVGGAPRRLGNLLGHDAVWSFDGEKIAYAKGSDLYVAKSDGSEPHRLVTLEGVIQLPHWSPDGRRLRVTLKDSKAFSWSLWEVSVDGTHPHPLLPGWNNPAVECCGNWTLDGRYFIFSSNHHNILDLWAIREDGALLRKVNHRPVQLTAGPMNFWFGFPTADNRLLVLGDQLRGELLRYDSGSKQFVPQGLGLSADEADFSKDGNWVAYVTYPEGVLWRSKLDGTQRLQLSFPPLFVKSPRWSPDGKRIAFAASSFGKNTKTYIVSAEGGTPERVTSEERNELDPSWFPDGDSIVFGRTPYDAADTSGSAVAIHRADLRTHEVSTLPGSEGLIGPECSPDGRNVAAMTVDSQKLMLFDSATRKWSELTRGDDMGRLAWSHDGKYVYFSGNIHKERGIFRVRTSDQRMESVASLRGIQLASDWIALTVDDSPVVVHDGGTTEIYALDWDAP